MSAELLDLDEIAPPQKEVKLFGVTYKLAVMSVNDFIDVTREGKRLEADVKDGKANEADVVEAYLGTVERLLPGIAPEHKSRLTFKQVEAILSFARDEAEKGAPKTASNGDTPGNADSAAS